MSGIDKIIKQIEDDTQTVCDDIIAKAQSKADKLLAEAEAEAAAIRERGEKACELRVLDIKKRSDSAAELEEKKIMLTAKQQIISDMLDKGIERVKSLSREEYFILLLRMIHKYSLPQNGVICFGRRDLETINKSLLSELSLLVKINEAANGPLILSDDPADIDAGFILKYGGIEENCSFDAIFLSEDETLKDKAGKLLFGKG